MADRSLTENLLNKYLHRSLMPSETRQFNDLLADETNEPFIKEIILKHVTELARQHDEAVVSVDFDQIYRDISTKLNIPARTPHTPVRLLRKILYGSAAAAILAGMFFIGRIFPFSHKELSDQHLYSYTEIKSPLGSRSEIKLPDGTVVTLNAGSLLKYRNDFNQNNRDIDLYGEAYFRVARNPEIPLIVTADYIDVIALGTEFNIKAYPEENIIEMTLIEGKVEIASSSGEKSGDEEYMDLLPNQKAIFYKDADEYKIENVNKDIIRSKPVKPFLERVLISPKADVEKTVAWTEGKLIFRGENLENLCIDLQRKYDVRFVFNEEILKKYRFTGVLMDETLEQVLDVIKLTAPIDFSIEGKTVYLSTDESKIDGFEEQLK